MQFVQKIDIPVNHTQIQPLVMCLPHASLRLTAFKKKIPCASAHFFAYLFVFPHTVYKKNVLFCFITDPGIEISIPVTSSALANWHFTLQLLLGVSTCLFVFQSLVWSGKGVFGTDTVKFKHYVSLDPIWHSCNRQIINNLSI